MSRRAAAGLVSGGAMFLLAVVAVTLGGCGATAPRAAASGQPSVQASPAVGPATTPPSPAASTATAPTGILVEFAREGGFAGLSDKLTVRADGGFTVVRLHPAVNRSGQLTATELAELRQSLTDAHVAEQPKTQLGTGNDLFTYQLTYGDIRIVAQDGSMVAPLRPVIAALSGIVNRYGS